MHRTAIKRWIIGLVAVSAVVFLIANFSIIRTKFSARHEFTNIDTFAECLNEETWTPFRWPQAWNGRKATVSIGSGTSDEFASVSNYLGWHVTWMILLDLREVPPTAYDALDGSTAMFVRALPKAVEVAIPVCGALFRGTIPQSMMERVLDAKSDPVTISPD